VSPVPPDLTRSIVRILAPDGSIAGTGFIVHQDGLIATCSHVVQSQESQARGDPRPEYVDVVLHATGDRLRAGVEPKCWRGILAEDVAILRLQGPLPEEVEPLPLGSSRHSRGHNFSSWGYRLADVFPGGLAAEGKIQARTLYRNQAALQLLSSQIDRGMSGAPLWDVQGRCVVGMINAFWETTRHQDAWLALAIPTETLRAVCPSLRLSDLCPYRGLEPFTEADAEFFFGRERAVEYLLECLRQEPRFLAVLGPSGSGKSSLVRAGLIPRLRRGAVPRSDRWAFIVIRPGRNPFGELEAEGLSDTSRGLVEAVRNWQRLHPEAERLTLALDQFEELLVDCPEETRREFVAQLAALLDSPLPITVILVMRDDFYSRFVREAGPLVKWLERGLANAPLTLEPDELRAIVEEPARAVGLALEKGLADVIAQEALEATPQGAPGTILPLLEFALTGLWERREEELLTHAAYQAIGGVTGGLTQWADGILSRLDEEQRQLARRVLTDLVHLGDESRNIPDSRRRRTLDELCRHEGEREAVHQVARLLANARLLVTGRDLSTGQETVELVHNALLREWGQLQKWIREDRRFLGWRQGVEERVREWGEKGQDEGLLLRGTPLTEAQEWLDLRAVDIEEETREFIRLSVERAEAEQRAREQLRRRITIGLATGLVIALVLATLAAWQWRRAEEQHNIALARQLAATGQLNFSRTATGPLIYTALGIRSLQIIPSVEADQLVRRGLDLLPRPIAQMSHGDGVNAVAVSPNGRLLISGSSDRTARIWDVNTGQEVLRILHNSPVLAVAFNSDSSLIISGSADKIAYIWEITIKQEVARLEHDGAVTAAEFSLNGQWVVTGSEDGTVRVWEIKKTKKGYEVTRVMQGEPMKHGGPVQSVALSPDGRLVASGSDDGTVRVWELITGHEVARFVHKASVQAVAFSPDGRFLVSGSDDHTAYVWEMETGREVAHFVHNGSVQAVDFSPDGRFWVSGSDDHTARVWETETGREVARFVHDGSVQAVDFSPDGHFVVTGSIDGSLRVWEAIPVTNHIHIMKHAGGVNSVAFSPDGDLVVSGSDDHVTQVWEVETGHKIASMRHDDRVTTVAFSPNGQWVVSGSDDHTVRVWEANTGCEIGRTVHGGRVTAVAFEPDGHWVVSGSSDGIVKVWESMTGREVISFTHEGGVNAVAFSPDGRWVASGGNDLNVRLWNKNTGQELVLEHNSGINVLAFNPNPNREQIASSSGNEVIVWDITTMERISSIQQESVVDAMVFSPDGNRIASSSGNQICVWETATGRKTTCMQHDEGTWVKSIAFSPNGQWLISGSGDRTARVWEISTGQEIARVVHDWPVTQVAFSPDSRFVVSSSGDQTVRVWLWRPEDLIAEACRRLPRNLTRAEWQQYIGPDVPYHPTCPNLPVPEE